MLTEQQELYITSRGEHLEELIAEANPLIIIGIINRGLATEYYDEWKTHGHHMIRKALAQNGHNPDFFITDIDSEVREAVVLAHPEYCEQLLAQNHAIDWRFILKQIDDTTDLRTIKTFLDAPVPNKAINPIPDEKDNLKLQAIRVMYTVKTSQPSAIEKTMSPSQLFQSQSPYWANDLALERIEAVLDLYDTIKTDIFFKCFNTLIETNDYHISFLRWELKANYRKET
jgi:hypothetical protein